MEAVRQCGQCGLPAAVLISDAYIEREGARFVCQACGASIRLPPKFGRVGRWMVGFSSAFLAILGSVGTFISALTARQPEDAIAGFAILGTLSLAMWLLSWKMLGAEVRARRWRIAPDAPTPIRYVGAPPEAARPEHESRRCECGARASCTAIRAQRLRSLRMGARYDHRCVRCGARFTVDDAAHTSFLFAAAALLLGIATLLLLHPPGAAVGATESNRWFGLVVALGGLGYSVLFARALGRRMGHPLFDHD